MDNIFLYLAQNLKITSEPFWSTVSPFSYVSFKWNIMRQRPHKKNDILPKNKILTCLFLIIKMRTLLFADIFTEQSPKADLMTTKSLFFFPT